MSVTLQTFVAKVPDIGDFVFRKRSLRDQVWIEADQLRITGGMTESDPLRRTAHAIATISRLTVSGPDGWDLASFDPLDDGAFSPVFKVYEVLRDAEEKFRARSGSLRPVAGTGA